MQIIVLGMHRSGTSVLTRLLNLMGASVGVEGNLIEPTGENAKGYWERLDIYALHQEVLTAVGADWYKVSQFEPGRLSAEQRAAFSARARNILSKLDAHRPWVLKDPRLCVLLPLWQELLEAPIYVHIWRNPLEVAQSLRTWKGFPIRFGIALWEQHNLAALHHTRGFPRLLVSHRDLMQRPVQTVRTFYKDLVALGVPRLGCPGEREITSFIEAALYRERGGIKCQKQFVNQAQAKLLRALEKRRVLQWKSLPALSAGSHETLVEYEERAAAEARRAAEVEALEGRVGAAEAARAAEVGELQGQVAAAEARRAAEVEALEGRVGAAEAARAAEVGELQGQVAAAEARRAAEVEALEGRVGAAEAARAAEVGELQGQVAAAEARRAAEVEALEGRVGAAEAARAAEVGELQGQVAAAEARRAAEVEALEGRVGAAEAARAAEVEALEGRVGAAEAARAAEVGELQGQVAAAEARRAAEVEALEGRVGAAEARRAAEVEALEGRVGVAEAARAAEVGELQGQVAAAEARRAAEVEALEGRVGAAEAARAAEVGELQGQVAAAEARRAAEVEALEGRVGAAEARRAAEVEALEGRVGVAEAARAAEVGELQGQVAAAEARRAAEVEALEGRVGAAEAARAAEVGELQGQVAAAEARRAAEVEALEGRVGAAEARRAAEVGELQGQVAAAEARRAAEVEALEGRVGAAEARRAAEVEALEGRVGAAEAARAAEVGELQGQVAAAEARRAAEVEALEGRVGAAEARRAAEVEALEGRVGAAEARRAAEVEALEGRVGAAEAARAAEVGELQGQVAAAEARRAAEVEASEQTAATEREAIIALFHNSHSWRIAAPLRVIGRVWRAIGWRGRGLLSQIARPIYYRAPLPFATKVWLKESLFTVAPLLFRHTIAYRDWTQSRAAEVIALREELATSEARRAAEEEARRAAEEEARRAAEEEARRAAEEEARRAAEEEARRAAEEEARRAAEEEARRAAEEEARRAAEEEARRAAEEEARRAAEEEARRAAEEEARRAAEEEARRAAEEEARRAAEEEARRAAEEEARRAAEEEARRAAEEEARRAAEEEARRAAEEEARRAADTTLSALYVAEAADSINPKTLPVKLIAFYLPQYHPIPENDEWWGTGFTEWTNVTKARPNYEGHYQPRRPADLGFYDLRVPEVMEQQAALARRYGLSGFCYYYYWFEGKRLLEMPLERMLATGQPDFPFCLAWANENWTRRWDGTEREILLAQHHSDADDMAVIRDLMRYFRHPNYIRINGKPLLLIYRIVLFSDIRRTVTRWREVCQREGIGDIYLAMNATFEYVGADVDPAVYGLDAVVEHPPHYRETPIEIPGRRLNPDYVGRVVDYSEFAKVFFEREFPDHVIRFRGVMSSWDNTPRQQNRANIFHGSDPEAYQAWLQAAIRQTTTRYSGDERLVFINGWNEWGEGSYLEPDRRYGFAYLEATRAALLATGAKLLPVTVREDPTGSPETVACPRVSIIVPNYNHERFLKQRLESIYSQQFTDFEVIILDDASTDGSMDIIAQYQERFSNKTRVIRNQKNSGNLFSQWLAGLDLAQGELVWIAESDDFADENFLRDMVAEFSDEAVLLAYGDTQYVNTEGEFVPGISSYLEGTGFNQWKDSYKKSSWSEFNGPFGVKCIIANVSGTVFRKPLLSPQERETLVKFLICGDWYFYSLIARGGYISFVKSAKNHFRLRDDSNSRSSYGGRQFYSEHFDILSNIKKIYGVSEAIVERHFHALEEVYAACVEPGRFSLHEVFPYHEIVEKQDGFLRICIASLGFYSGGGEVVSIDLANRLRALGHSVTFFALGWELGQFSQEQRRRLRSDIPVCYRETMQGTFQDLQEELGCQILNTHCISVDLFLFEEMYNPLGLWVLTQHGSYEALLSPANGQAADFFRNYEKAFQFVDFVKNKVDHWVLVSKKSVDILSSMGIGSTASTHIPNGVPDPVNSLSLRKISRDALNIPAEAFVFIIASRAIPEKGWEHAICAMEATQKQANQELYLILLGEGPEADRLRNENIDQHHLRFLGYQADVASFIRLADAGVMPTYYQGETSSLFAMECLMEGIPVIISDVSDCRDTVSDATGRSAGIVIRPKKSSATFESDLSKAMICLVNSRQAYREMCSVAVRMKQKFLLDTNVQRYEELFSKLQSGASCNLNSRKQADWEEMAEVNNAKSA